MSARKIAKVGFASGDKSVFLRVLVKPGEMKLWIEKDDRIASPMLEVTPKKLLELVVMLREAYQFMEETMSK